MIIPTQMTAISDGATQHRPDGSDPYMGVAVAIEEAPFQTVAADATPEMVAEYILTRWGQEFAAGVVTELGRWW